MIETVPDEVLVFGQDEQADFYEPFVSIRKKYAKPEFLNGMHHYRDLLDPDLDDEEIAKAKENGQELVEVLTVTISR